VFKKAPSGAFFYGRCRKSGIKRLYDVLVSNGVFSFCAYSVALRPNAG
jgi:hypothetical protein